MNNEIKEILDKLKDSADNTIDTEVDQFTEEAYDVPNYFVLDPITNECRILLDYITNLQEENERVSNLYETYEEANELWIKKCENYKSRIDKAIELINAWLEGINNDDIIILLNNLGNILQGSDKE